MSSQKGRGNVVFFLECTFWKGYKAYLSEINSQTALKYFMEDRSNANIATQSENF